jgi:hypothetical protein
VRTTRRWIPILAALALACGGGGTKDGSVSAASAGVHGTLTYDRVPTTPNAGLAYAATVQKPIRGAVVRLVDASSLATLAETTSDASGSYALTIPAGAPAQVRVAALAKTVTPQMEVRDNTDGALWAAVSAPFAPADVQKDLRATSGWTGAQYDPKTRIAAPFAILDSMLTAAQGFLAVRQPAFPPLTLNWSPNNVPQAGLASLGQIGTSHWDGDQLYILGAEDVDTDEFDDHVIVHEWGHYFESKLSRSDSPGGVHAVGDEKDPRLSWSEGWGNGLSAILLYPDTVYRDTQGAQQATTAIDDDIEQTASGPQSDDPNPGWWSEASVERILLEIFDPAGGRDGTKKFDRVSLGLGPIYDVAVGAQKTTPRLTSVFTFVTALKAANPASAADIDTLLAERGFSVTDDVGSGNPRLAPLTGEALYQPVVQNSGPVTLRLAGSASNDVNANRYLTVSGNGAQMTVSAKSVGDVGITVFQAGAVVASADQFFAGATEKTTFATTAGLPYVIVLTGFESAPGTPFDYTADLTLTSP